MYTTSIVGFKLLPPLVFFGTDVDTTKDEDREPSFGDPEENFPSLGEDEDSGCRR